MDLDETVLDNSEYQVELYNKKEKYNPDSWDKWVLKEEAELVPGSYDYISFLRSNDIQIIFISNRMHKRLEETKNNMKKLGIYSEGDIYLLRIDRADKKTIRRAEIFDSSGRMKGYNQFKIIQYLGDAIGDFEVETLDRFGLDQFVFPNPMYGKW
jgi:5'-nucleotidase (lipoprotein e(P4) family)